MATATARRPRPPPALVTITLPELAKGEHYAGILLGDDGKPAHHLVLIPGDTKLNWADAGAWAKKQGGELPTRREQSLLFANLRGKFERDWYWSERAGRRRRRLGLVPDFSYGYQTATTRTTSSGRARSAECPFANSHSTGRGFRNEK
jgi:hypothetical protein